MNRAADDFEFIRNRLKEVEKEVFPPDWLSSTLAPQKTCDMCGAEYINGSWNGCTGSCCD